MRGNASFEVRKKLDVK